MQGDAPVNRARKLKTHLLACLFILLVSVGIKFSVWQLTPQIFNDTPGYLVPAISLLSGHGYGVQENGFRTPTYPLFLAALLAPIDHTAFVSCSDAHRPACIGKAADQPSGAFALRWIVLAQILLGIATTLLLYALGWELTNSAVVAFFFGISYAWNVATAFWEISLLTESLTAFLLMLALWLTLRVGPEQRRSSILLAFVLGALALCHQLYLAFWMIPAAILALRYRRQGLRRVLPLVSPVLIVPLLFVGAWSAFNYFENGFFTPSTLSGYVLIQMVAPAVENLPDGYDGITQTYVGYRDAQVREVGTYSGAIYRAWRDMIEQTDLNWSQISSKLQTGSIYLAYHYPAVYLNSVRYVSREFWDFALFHYEPIPAGVASFAARFTDAALQWNLNRAFWFAPVLWCVCWFVQIKTKRRSLSVATTWKFAFLYLVVWYAALVSSLTNYGDNERYRVVVMPLQYGSIVVTLWALWQTFVAPLVWHSHRLPHRCGKTVGM